MAHMIRDKEEEHHVPSLRSAPDYPFGLCISLTGDELEKLGKSHEDFEVDDIIHFASFGVVTSVSHTKSGDNECCRVEIQLTHLQMVEDEDKEVEENESRPYF